MHTYIYKYNIHVYFVCIHVYIYIHEYIYIHLYLPTVGGPVINWYDMQRSVHAGRLFPESGYHSHTQVERSGMCLPIWGVGCMTQMFVSRRDRVARFFLKWRCSLLGNCGEWRGLKTWPHRPWKIRDSQFTVPERIRRQSLVSLAPRNTVSQTTKDMCGESLGFFSLLIDAVVLPVRRSCFLSFHLHGATDLCGWLNQSQWEHYHSQGLDQAGCPAFGTMALSHVSSLEGCTYSCSCMFVAHHMTAPKFG